MSGFKIRSGSTIIASSDLMKKGNYVPQAHYNLESSKEI